MRSPYLKSRGVHLLDLSSRHPALRLALAATLALTLAVACAAPARAAYMLPTSPNRPKDFTLVKSQGVYHLFYILDSASSYPDQTENSFGHAVSNDLYHWTQLPPVLQVDPAGWDNLHVWAPTIVFKDSLWWMLYTGVTLDARHNRTQRIGLAVSSDLETWTRVDHPVYDAPQVPWAWADSLSSAPAFRDPFVMADPDNPGSWLMFFTASLSWDSTATVVGVARSSGDFTQWTDAGPLLETWRNYTFNALTESPHVVLHGGLYYLFMTTSSSQPLSLFTAPSPTAPLMSWTSRGRLRSVLGYDTSSWFASETFNDGNHTLFGFVNGDRIEFREMQFGGSWGFSLLQPEYFHVMDVDFASHTLYRGDTTALFIRVANPAAGQAVLRTFLVDVRGNETEAVPESLGLPSMPALPYLADTLSIPWIARQWPRVPDTDSTSIMRVIVRAADSTAVSGMLTVWSRVLHAPWGPPPHGPPPQPPIEEPDPPKVRMGPWVRQLDDPPLTGEGVALSVGLAVPATARVDVFDVLGRRVRNLVLSDLPAGITVLAWDGHDGNGARLGRGVYFARLQIPGRTCTGRVLLLRR